jgi:hypothetical protein
MDDDESALHDSPTDFMSTVANSGGTCDAQSVIPEGDHFLCRCSCGGWTTKADTREEGLRLAQAHTSASV